ncbi:MAG: BMP family ABC transporter substrate-binding protein [Deltaproteobacteria bacterium]|nr:BMP family ABC transporter substrate-binding protein [Deltaproteobacteria bacterium]
MSLRTVAALALGALVAATPRPSRAFSSRSGFTIGCHEGITLSALIQSGLAFDAEAVRLPPDDRWQDISRAIFPELAIVSADPRTDFAVFSLIAGVRSPDTGGTSPLNLLSLHSVHTDAGDQYEHCLRERHDDGAPGDLAAWEGCVDFIRGELAEMTRLLAAPLDARNERHSFALDFYGTVTLEVWGPTYHLGRASHALQDSFSHAIRSADLRTIYSLLNYVDAALGTLEESRDGMAHSSHADECDGVDLDVPAAAVDATADVMRAIAQGAPGDLGKRVDAVLSKWLRYQPGCTVDNAYCDSPWVERARQSPTTPLLGCAGADSGVRQGVLAACLALMLASALRRRRLALWLVLVAAVAGCDHTLPRDAVSVKVLYPVGGKGDHALADSIAAAIVLARWQFELQLEEVEPASLGEARAALDRVLDGGAPDQLVVTGGHDYTEALRARGCDLGAATVLHLDGHLDECPRLRSVSFLTFAPSFEAGVAAVTKLRGEPTSATPRAGAREPVRVGAIGTAGSPAVREALAGFEAGIRYAGGELLVSRMLTEGGSEPGPDAARAAALALYEETSLVFCAAGELCLPVVETAEELAADAGQPRYVIGVGQDFIAVAPDVVLGSVLRRADRVVRESIFAFDAHELEAGDVAFGEAEGYTELLINLQLDGQEDPGDISSPFLVRASVEAAREAARAAEAGYRAR